MVDSRAPESGARRSAAAAMSTLVAGGVRVEYSEIGLGPPVVMIHSAPGTGGQWRAVADSLKDAYRILAVNLHGIGETQPWPGPGHMAIDDDPRRVSAALCPELDVASQGRQSKSRDQGG